MKPTAVRLYDFTGGLNTKSPPMVLKMNEASDLQNINLLPTGGFEKRNGNSVFNATAMDSGAAVHGLGYFRTSLTADYLMAIAGTKLFKSDNLDGTMDDITGAVSITTGQDKIWTHYQMNNLSIFIGGAPDAPIKWNGTGNAAVLGGTPPSGEFGIVANRRLFIGNTATNPSRLQWCILGNPEDWNGTGSGSQDVGLNDGDTLVGASVIGMDSMLLFKQNSIHTLAIRSAPFPLFPLFSGVGAVSKRAIVNVDGIVYFITTEPRMKATDGTNVYSFPDSIDNVWDSLSKSRLKYIHGVHNRRLRQIWWFVSTSSATTHDLCLIWDLERKCWLRNTTGYSMNVSAFTADRIIYSGTYNGKIYKLDDSTTANDASETSSTINAFWRSGWLDFVNTLEVKTPQYADISFGGGGDVDFYFGCGFDFNEDRNIESIVFKYGDLWGVGIWDFMTWGGNTHRTKLIQMKGSGKFIQFSLRHAVAGQRFNLNGIEVGINKNQVSALR
jgi:hypothetical protein